MKVDERVTEKQAAAAVFFSELFSLENLKNYVCVFSGFALNLAVDEIIRLVMSNLHQVFQMVCLWMAPNQMQHLNPRLGSWQRNCRMRYNQCVLFILMRMADQAMLDGKKETSTRIAYLHQCHPMALVSWYVAMELSSIFTYI